MTSSYLTRRKLPLAAALLQMLKNIETELTKEKLEAEDKGYLRRQAEFIRWLLTPRLIT